jgi:hypothetical protein
LAADDGGKPRGDAAQAGDGDDLDALAGGLGSVEPGEGDAPGDDDGHDLAALGALAARTTLASPEAEEASVSLSGGGAAAVQADKAAAALTDQPVRASALAAAATPASLDLPSASARPRAGWVTPLLIGIGVGVGMAGGLYALSQRSPAQHASAAPTAVPAASPAEPPTAEPFAAAQPAPAAVPAPEQAPAAAPAAAARVAAPAAPRVADRGHVPPSASATPAARAVAEPRGAPPASAADEGSDEPSMDLVPEGTTAAEPAPELTLEQKAAAAAEVEATDKPTRMDALLDQALSPKARRDELAARQQAALEANAIPATPSREEVTQAMTVLLPAIRGCAMGQSGLATAGIVVHSDGRVASVEIAGAPFAGSASGRCMEGVIRRARFPRFTQPSFRIKFPLAIQ